MAKVQFTITPAPPTQRQHAVAAYRATEAAIRADREAMALIQATAGDMGDQLIRLVAWGEAVWRNDDRFRQQKPERDKSVERIAAAAAKLAKELRATTWPGLGCQEVTRPGEGTPMGLPHYLDWLARFAREQQLDFPDHYPPGQSRTSRRDFLLRHIKTTVRSNGLLKDRRHLDKLAATIARAVLNDPGIDEDTVKHLK